MSASVPSVYGAAGAAAEPPHRSLLGDTSEWEHSAADRDVDEADEAAADAMLSALAGSDAAADQALQAKIAAARAATEARSAQQAGFASFVKESREVELLLQSLPYADTAAPRLCAIFDLYQEQCELLDPHLPHAVTALMNFVHSVIRPGKSNPLPPANSMTGAIKVNQDGSAAATADSAVYTPTGAACNSTELLTRVFKVIYSLAKVRGYKTILHFFPHEVADLEPALALLQKQSMEDHETWETRYGILLWISIIVLIPFDLNSVDSTMANPATAVASSSAAPALGPGGITLGSTGIISSLISLGCMYLSDTGPPREAAAVMLSKLFSRADMHARHLAAFFQWCTNEITRVNAEQAAKATGAGAAANASKNVFLLTGIFRALVQTFRHAPRDVLRRHVAQVFPSVLLPASDTWTATSNTLLRKLFVKLAQRVGLTYLPVRVAKWRYQRGHRSLLTTLQQATATSSSATAPSNPALGSAHAQTPSSASSEIDPEDDDVPDEIETIIQILLDGLRDRDTIVRWSSAKGIGRLTNCLSATFGDDVVGAVLDLFTGREGDAAWHGGCLALAELARRGLLLPQRLDAVVPITLRALTYDQRTATHSVGAHVRDASCYVIWAFARAYAPDVMAPYMNRMAQGLMTISVFDREVNVRRAASAAFQEHVGRQGSSSFPHGMAILQLADYFTIANRTSAYTVVANQVALYPEYTLGLVDHLVEFKVKHWEKEVRTITAQALGILTKRNAQSQEYMKEFVLGSLLTTAVNSTDLLEKHGALLSVASILQSLWELDSKDYLPMPLRTHICDVVNRLSSPAHASLLNGRGGQIMREALCGVIEAVARTHVLTSSPAMMQYMRAYQSILDENLQHSNEEVQVAATRAIEQFVRAYYLPSSTDDAKQSAEKLARARPVMDHYTRTLLHPSSLAGATRGFASALGTLPRALLVTTTAKAAEVYAAVPNAAAAASSASSSSAAAASSALPCVQPTATSLIYQPLSRILQSLMLTASECAQADAETRRNAVQAIVRLVDTITEDDLLQFMTPLPPPPAAANVTVAAPSAPAAGVGSSAAREKELKLAAKHAKVHAEALSKYWHRDLNELGLGTNANRVVDRIATTLLVCLDDYATDNRGDVGSWVREAAMVGLETLLHKLARMQQTSPDAVVFLPLLSERVFPALLKQSVEKIDRVREKAGQIFFRLLWSGAAPAAAIGVAATAVEIPFIPARDELRARFPFTSAASGTSASARSVREDKSVDWSSPSQTFPLLVPLLSLPLSASHPHVYPYHRSLLSGLLISVGGLTESVVKCSSEAFLAYVSDLSSAISSKGEDASEELSRLKYLAESLLAILLAEKGHARVVVPAFKTLELLLSNGLLEPLSLDVSSFAPSLQSRVWKEVSASQNIHKLMACIPVLVGLLAYPPPLRTHTLSNLLTLLGHATFPKVRRLTAEALYNALLVSGDELIPGSDEDPEKAQPVLDVMTLTPWDGPVGPARIERDKLYEWLQVPKPKLKAKAAGGAGGVGAGAAANQGDISALSNEYSSLVRQIGY